MTLFREGGTRIICMPHMTVFWNHSERKRHVEMGKKILTILATLPLFRYNGGKSATGWEHTLETLRVGQTGPHRDANFG